MTAHEVDVVVIGGGGVGTGAALDAATRGLSVALLEARDWASGTSSRSSKLIHGGLRYLEMLEFGLVREALRERGLILTRLAPHLARPVPFLFPITHRMWERAYVGAGVALYDAMAFGGGHARGLPLHRHLSHRQVLDKAPGLRPDAMVGAIQYYDAQLDDARHTLALARTAAMYGALCANRVKVAEFLREGERVVGVRARDVETGADLEVRARQVVNATGVWTDDVQALVGERGPFSIRASKGIHLVVPRQRIRSTSGLIMRTEHSVLFVIPWGRHWVLGTTDTEYTYNKAHPAASATDIDYVLSQVNRVLADPVTRDDVEGVYVGLRPLISAGPGEAGLTSKVSREHVVASPVPGLVVVAGGKYTTYRVMAADAVDEAARNLPQRVPGSITAEVPLVGAEGYRAMWNSRLRLAAESGLHVARIEHLLRRYGDDVHDLLALVAARPELAHPLAGAEDHLGAEIVYAATHEGARHLDDVLARRTRISIEAWDRGVAAARPAAELLAPVLGWDAAAVDREVSLYEARVEAERASNLAPDDAAADAARLGAPEVVPT
ncbi:MAG: glycerol-3-phosphate dehydrogenase/oxidase [Kineosporiaceae bacterium]